MGWISDRHMRSGGTIGGTKGMVFKDKPLRNILYIIKVAESMFDRDLVMLECGHQVLASGMKRAHCWKCRDGKPVDKDELVG
jgi:hypothetical protein